MERDNAKIELVDFPILVRKYRTTLTKKFLNRKFYTAPNPCEIESHIPGTIITIMVKEGDIVKEGTTLLILEAMKMLNEIAMPFDGRIVKINVSEGERVPKGHVMIEIEDQQ
ncbi:MAG: acetyl-CoA carboxylase biotin carboxyl carrier protein subunit [Cytophagaceae bacterium]|jgi:biotin carboxyl carrier protein|nr:acetyl-CoA carboxylase biotin carboxyl carrier protein subunit [Cytophagaceae bacterium]